MERSEYRCTECGLESPEGIGFRRVGRRHLCHGCRDQLERRQAGADVSWWIVLVLAAAGTAGLLGGWEATRKALASLLAVYVGGMLTTAFHELGHALAARLVGYEVRGIHIGTGPGSVELQVLGVPVRFGWSPSLGLTFFEPKRVAGFRTRSSVVMLAGPAAHVAAILLGWVLIRDTDIFFFDPRWLLWGAWAGLGLNLIPVKMGGRPTDAAQVVRLLLTSDEALEEDLTVLERGIEHDRRIQQAMPAITAGTDPARLRELREFLLEEVSQVTDPGARAIRLNNLASVDVTVGDPALRTEADEASAEALRLMPDYAAIRSTRGAVLVWLERDQEAVPLLRNSLGIGAREDGFTAGFLALALIRQGDLFEARTLAERSFDGGFRAWPIQSAVPLIGRAEAQLLVESFGAGTHEPTRVVAEVERAAGSLARTIGRSVLAWYELASPGDREAFGRETGASTEDVAACARMLAG